MYENTAAFYDLFDGSNNEQEVRYEFLNSYIDKDPAKILDIGCGLSSVAFSFANDGHDIYCFESSAPMYSLVLDRLKPRRILHNHMTLFPCALEKVDKPLKADMIYATYLFSHITFEEKKKLIQSCSRHLKKGGRLVFNCMQESELRKDQPHTEVGKNYIGDMVYRHSASTKSLSPTEHLVNFQFDVEYEGQNLQSQTDEFKLYCDSESEITKLLEETSLKVVERFANFYKDELSEKSPGFVIVAELN